MKNRINQLTLYLVIFGSWVEVVQSLVQKCIPTDFGDGNLACVCNATYCDYVGPLRKDPQSYYVFTSNYDGDRLTKTSRKFGSATNIQRKRKRHGRRTKTRRKSGKTHSSTKKGKDHGKHWHNHRKHKRFYEDINEIRLDHGKKYQRIIGFGGTFTDSTGICVNSMGEDMKKHILRSYFSEDGIEYNLARVPIGGTDFSTHLYSYDDGPEDPKLLNFALQKEDREYKIPLIKEAKKLSKDLQLFASAWVAPIWMKTNNDAVGGEIEPSMYQTWADYHLRFLEEYQKNGVDIWGITTGNEPDTAIFPITLSGIPSSYWSPDTMSTWISQNLGPTIRNSKHSGVKIMALDDQRFNFPFFFNFLFEDNLTFNYVDGLAVHWYFDGIAPAELLTMTHEKYPSKFILGTEACEGSSIFSRGPRLGDWSRAMSYAKDIIQDLENWVTGWTDWNMALNLEGGPAYLKNFVDSPILVDPDNKVFYKQPMFYAMGHFSKFIPKDSVRIDVSNQATDLEVVAFDRPDGGTSIVIYNEQSYNVLVVIRQANRGDISLNITPNSITTVVHW